MNSPKKILVVDDNKDAADSLAKLLAHFQHEASVAYDGPQAISIIENFKADVVLLDIGLPVMNGYEVAQRLRKMYREGGSKVLLIALSGYGQDEDKKLSMAAGCDEHFTKPIDIQILNQFINSTLPK